MFSPTYKLLFLGSLVITCATTVLSTTPDAKRLTDLFPHLAFDKSFNESFGGPNLQRVNNGTYINLVLDKFSGSGFASRDKYYYGFFSAAIKLPASYSAGVVVAFYTTDTTGYIHASIANFTNKALPSLQVGKKWHYQENMSNADVYPHNHDEIDFELLGHEKRKEWVLQTNVYGNGSVGTGREEKFYLWFDPTEQFHEYSIVWNYHHIVFLVDNIPVREVNHSQAMSSAYPSKPMSVYSTIWDGSEWATHGGKKAVNYNFAPFVASFRELEMEGCIWNQTKKTVALCSNNSPSTRLSLDPVEGEEFTKLSQQQKMGMDWARGRFMFYSYCADPGRFQVLPPECKEKLGLAPKMKNFFKLERNPGTT